MNVTENDEKHSVIWWMFMSVTLESAVFMEKNYSDKWHSIKNTKDLTMKQMFDITAKLVVRTRWDLWSENNWVGKFFMEVFVFDWWWTSHQSSGHKGLRLFRFCIVLVRYTRNPNQTLHGNKDWSGSNVHRNREPWHRIDGDPMEFEENVSQDSIRCSSMKKSKSYCWD